MLETTQDTMRVLDIVDGTGLEVLAWKKDTPKGFEYWLEINDQTLDVSGQVFEWLEKRGSLILISDKYTYHARPVSKYRVLYERTQGHYGWYDRVSVARTFAIAGRGTGVVHRRWGRHTALCGASLQDSGVINTNYPDELYAGHSGHCAACVSREGKALKL